MFDKTLRLTVIVVAVLGSSSSALHAAETVPTFLENLDTSVGIVVGVVAFITGLIGLPVAWMSIRFTRHKISNLALENEKIRLELNGLSESAMPGNADGLHLEVDGDNNSVTITSDPRLAGPILILINFAISLTLLMLITYGKNAVVPVLIYLFGVPISDAAILITIVSSAIPFLFGLLLFVPVVKDAWRVRDALRMSVELSAQDQH